MGNGHVFHEKCTSEIDVNGNEMHSRPMNMEQFIMLHGNALDPNPAVRMRSAQCTVTSSPSSLRLGRLQKPQVTLVTMAYVSGFKRDAVSREQLADGELATQMQKSKRPRLSEKEAAAQKRYLLFIEYNGNDFSGSQRQKKGVRTVQDACEKALETMTKQV